VKKPLALAILLCLTSLYAYAEVTFSGLDLSSENKLLFQSTTDVPGYGQYDSLFLSDLVSGDLRQMTFFPEDVMLLGTGGRLQIQNRYGVFRSDENLEGMSAIESFPAFVNGRQIAAGKITPMTSSPNGRFLSYLRATSPAYGQLVLYDVQAEEELVVTEGVEMTLSDPPVAWSPDSQFFIYSKQGTLYYYSVSQLIDDRVLSEEFRTLGDGVISSVRWSRDNRLYYLTGSVVYQILSVEFFTRSLYQDLLSIGRVVGKIPFNFDPNFDTFWIAPDGSKLLLNRGGRNIILYVLQADDFRSTGGTVSLPYLFLPRNTMVEQVVWSASDVLTLLTMSIHNGAGATSVYRLDLSSDREVYAFEQTEDTDVRQLVLSPDEQRIGLVTSAGVRVKSYATWSDRRSFPHPQPLHAVWRSNRELIVSGREISESIDTSDGTRTFVSFSQAESYGFDPESGKVLVRSGNRAHTFDPDGAGWTAAGEATTASPGVASDKYRVYLEQLTSGSYRNMVMVRNIEGVGTNPLFEPPERTYEPFPTEDQAVSFDTFRHGSRIRRREVAFVFNAVDSVSGLTKILDTLSEYGIRATFFLNGDFIRRHPGAVLEIAESGHEVGSLFFTYFDMTDARFQITKEFIKQGLARNEDEYFQTTGHELSLLWHAPYYFLSSEIVAAGQDVNYTYVGTDVDSLDWVPKRDESGTSRLYYPTSELIERILTEKKPGSIISMTVGVPAEDKPYGGREDYLFQRLDLLINNLVDRGYSVEPVSVLMERAR
jgi:peptidoglycan/xylan/chitin deacetylase (PgdA/CDA1 family)